MFSLLQGLWKYFFRKEEFFVVILGLHNAGKTVSYSCLVCPGGGFILSPPPPISSPLSPVHTSADFLRENKDRVHSELQWDTHGQDHAHSWAQWCA